MKKIGPYFCTLLLVVLMLSAYNLNSGYALASTASFEDSSSTSSHTSACRLLGTPVSDFIDWLKKLSLTSPQQPSDLAPPILATNSDSSDHVAQSPPSVVAPDETIVPHLVIQAGEKIFTAKLDDNPSTQALLAKLPLTIEMSEINGNEKYYYFPDSLPTNSQEVGRVKSGDLMLYGSDCLVLFYEGFPTSYSYTRLGSLDDATGLAAALGRGKVQITLSISP